MQPYHAFRWTPAGGMEDLGVLSNGASIATAINNAGLITGYATAADGNAHAFLWSRSQGMRDLGTLGGYDSYAVAISAAGSVAGNSGTFKAGEFNYHGFFWRPADGMRDIGTLGGDQSGVLAMSETAQVVGVATVSSGEQHAISWTRSGGLVDLGTLGGGYSRALGVNNRGQVVGSAHTAHQRWRAFIWTRVTGLVDLNLRLRDAPDGLKLDAALAISDNGSIVASSNAGLVLLTPRHRAHSAPVVGLLAAPEAVAQGARWSLRASFADADDAETHTARINWGDGSAEQSAAVGEKGGTGTASASHNYAAPGVYAVTMRVTDSGGRSTTVRREVVVHAAGGRFVAGGGSFMSPMGASKQAPLHAGPATFRFVAGVDGAAGSSTPAQLHFSVMGLNLRSEGALALAFAGSQASVQGSARVNGAPGYGFAMQATDGSPDQFAIRVWHTDPASKAEVVDYDSGGIAVAGLAGGAISATPASLLEGSEVVVGQ